MPLGEEIQRVEDWYSTGVPTRLTRRTWREVAWLWQPKKRSSMYRKTYQCCDCHPTRFITHQHSPKEASRIKPRETKRETKPMYLVQSLIPFWTFFTSCSRTTINTIRRRSFLVWLFFWSFILTGQERSRLRQLDIVGGANTTCHAERKYNDQLILTSES